MLSLVEKPNFDAHRQHTSGGAALISVNMEVSMRCRFGILRQEGRNLWGRRAQRIVYPINCSSVRSYKLLSNGRVLSVRRRLRTLRPDLRSPEAEAVAETTARLVKLRNLEQAPRSRALRRPSESPHRRYWLDRTNCPGEWLLRAKSQIFPAQPRQLTRSAPTAAIRSKNRRRS